MNRDRAFRAVFLLTWLVCSGLCIWAGTENASLAAILFGLGAAVSVGGWIISAP